MPYHPFQKLMGELKDSFLDAMLLDLAVEKSLEEMQERRRNETGYGGGRPPSFHKALNRAVVVAAVGGIEAYFERLAIVARDDLGAEGIAPNKDWYQIKGRNGSIQTPNPRNIRKLYWSLFHFDPVECWKISVTTSESENGGSGTWRQAHATIHEKDSASNFFTNMVSIRHAMAHADPSKPIPQTPGIVGKKKSVHSHHAYNAVSASLQISLQTTIALATHLEHPLKRPRWNNSWNKVSGDVGMAFWLAETPVMTENEWNGSPPSNPNMINSSIESEPTIPTISASSPSE